MQYAQIVKATFMERPNRFIANVLVDGKPVVSHVKNTGRCKELLVPGATVYLEDFDGRMGTRKLRYSLIAVEKKTPRGPLLINMDSQAPNVVVREALEAAKKSSDSEAGLQLPALGKLTLVKPETVYGISRFDFYLEGSKGKGFLEVKGVTLESDGIASFPDAPTERGVKHIEELIKAKEAGFYAGILFVIQMEGMRYMKPNDATHPQFGDALRKASKAGVEVMARACDVAPDSLILAGPIPVKL